MDFDDFVCGLKTVFFGGVLLVVASLLITAFVMVAEQVHFFVNKNLDISTGKVYCDNNNVYTGRLYRVRYSLETENLQAPQYYLKILDKDLYMKKDAEYFCKDFHVTENK